MSVVPTGLPSTYTVTVLPASAVPPITSVLSEVTPSPGAPVSFVTLVTAGAAGAMVSMVTASAAEAGPVLPAASVAVALML